MPSYDHLIEPYVTTTDGLDVLNPATGETVAVVKAYDVQATHDMVEAADQAFADWAKKTAKERAVILHRWHDLIVSNRDALAMLVTAECGKPLSEAQGEVAYGASFVEWFAEEGKRLYGDVIPHHAPGRRILVTKQPIGVTAAITPWNFPIAMITRKAAPALAAGCPMLVKPAEATPLSALALEKLAHEAGIPVDVFRVIPTTGPVEVGQALCANAAVRKLSFTGSTPVGKTLIRQCADTVKKVSMELGGNAPFIVFDDADIDAAIEGALVSKYRNAGQTCVCANRFLVQSNIHDTFVAKLVERVETFRIGNGADKDVHIGPLINEAAVIKTANLVEQATAEGAKLETGGKALEGNFYAPTVLTGVSADMEISNSEVFGPVAPIIRFDTEEEALRIANDTPYGLAAYFYAKDMARIWRMMEGLEYGMVGVNDGLISTEVAPFGGVKESGIGREGSRYGIEEYVEMKYCLLGGLSQ